MNQINKALLRSKKVFNKLKEVEPELVGELGFVGIANLEREIYEIDRALDELHDNKNGRIISEDVIEYMKDIIIHSEGELSFEERTGIDKALKKLQDKYDID